MASGYHKVRNVKYLIHQHESQWIVREYYGSGRGFVECVRGRYPTEAEAKARVAELQENNHQRREPTVRELLTQAKLNDLR